MRKKILCVLFGATLFMSAYNVYVCSNKEQKLDVCLENIDAKASNESGIHHGRPLLYAPGFGYKCANCTGHDCGAVC